ncbi:MAG: DUF1214 domain-containing protein [Acidobacteriota bacterium]|nr:MAG: DUF1214 domain-containing protein [Acidobacteriota bacterium]
MKIPGSLVFIAIALILSNLSLAQEKQDGALSTFEQFRLTDYIHWYSAIEQQAMMDEWLKNHQLGTWSHSGRVGADDRTVITPQADVNYGYNWFNISNGPMVIELPEYERYSSLSIFDMHHFVEDVIVNPNKPIVIRLANQKSPRDEAHDVVLSTNSGLAFLRMVIPAAEDEADVMRLTREIKTTGGDGTEPFIIPSFTDKERSVALEIIKDYGFKQKTGNNMFGKTSQGVGDLDRAAGVYLGQLGIPAEFVQYTQYVRTADGEALGGDGHYEIRIDPKGLIRDKSGYWSITLYNMEDRYLISNPQGRYSITSYTAAANSDGTYTVRTNPDGKGENAIPTMKKPVYAVMRVYQPMGTIDFPPISVARD